MSCVRWSTITGVRKTPRSVLAPWRQTSEPIAPKVGKVSHYATGAWQFAPDRTATKPTQAFRSGNCPLPLAKPCSHSSLPFASQDRILTQARRLIYQVDRHLFSRRASIACIICDAMSYPDSTNREMALLGESSEAAVISNGRDGRSPRFNGIQWFRTQNPSSPRLPLVRAGRSL